MNGTSGNSGQGRKDGRSVWAIALCLMLVLGAIGAGLRVRSDYLALPPLPEIAGLSLSPVVLDREDRLLRAFVSADDKWRLPVQVADVDPLYFKMLLAFEDKRFHQHGGVDPKALLRAAGQAIRAGRIVSGGSTLTMQVARLLDERPTRSLPAKYRQILRALQIERRFTKEEILTLYALRAPFGGNLEGVRAASLVWFGKEPARLTPAEAAFLVALPQSPEGRRPDRFPAGAKAARDRVLKSAAVAGVLAPDDAGSAMSEPLRTMRRAIPFLAPHESRAVVAAAPGKPVHRLTIDKDLQAAVEQLARSRAARLAGKVSLAVLVADHQSGEILASVGSPDLLDEARLGHVDMTKAVRSPGSTLKPFIYGLAFEERIGHPESLIDDRPTTIGGYRPTNFDEAYQGTVTLREALQLSLNTPAVQLLEAVGPARLLARLKRAGAKPVLSGGVPAGLAIGLGGLGMTLRDLGQAYAALARQGQPIALSSCSSDCAPGDIRTDMPVLSPQAARQIGDILSGMPQTHASGEAGIAYKTGTAYGYRDSWAAGYDGQHVVAIWVGRPDGSPVPGQTGAKTAVPILFDVFQRLGPKRVPLPPSPVQIAGTAPENGPPPALAWARVAAQQESGGNGRSTRFSISYPPDGADIDLGLLDAAQSNDQPKALVVKLDGGRPPFAFILNGRPVADPEGRLSARFLSVGRIAVSRSGFSTITAVDRNGQSATVTVSVR